MSEAWPSSIVPTPIELLVESAKESRAKLVVATVLPSTVITPAEDLAIVVSVAWPSSILLAANVPLALILPEAVKLP